LVSGRRPVHPVCTGALLREDLPTASYLPEVLAALDVATEDSPQILVSDIRLAGTAGEVKTAGACPSSS
jgi:hypothetical protein